MSDSEFLRPEPSASSRARRHGGGGMARVVLYLGLLGVVGYVGYAQYRTSQDKTAAARSQDTLVSKHGLTEARHKSLSAKYKDKDGNLFADPPVGAQQLLDPEVLVLAHYQEKDGDSKSVDWKDFAELLERSTGKRVQSQLYKNRPSDVAAVESSTYHVIALHAADTPFVVNNAGFVPVAVLGNREAALGNRLDIAVNAKSPVKSLSDLRGKQLTCTAPDSITGYRAAVAVLSQLDAMRPDTDYFINFSTSQKRSIAGLAAGDYEIAAISDDKYQSMVEAKEVQPKQIRIVYRSEVIPRLTIGHVYNLKPELVEKISDAIVQFQNENGAPDPDSGKPMRFFRASYKKDFEFVRQIDDSFDPRFSKERDEPLDANAEKPTGKSAPEK